MFLTECLLTRFASERFLSGMNSCVLDEVELPSKILFANVAFERSFAVVSAHVSTEVLLYTK